MINKQRIQEVIKAVRNTPAELLAAGEPVDNKGCLCAIGAWAYENDREFADAVNALRTTPLPDSVVEYISMSAYTLFREYLPKEHYDTTSQIFVINDRSFNVFQEPDECKAEILRLLEEIAA